MARLPQPDGDLSQDRLLTAFPRDKKGRPVIGAVSLVRKIGAGAMGSVYLGRQDDLQRDVAVKILPFTLLEADPGLARRFTSEARIAAKLESEHVVRVFGSGLEHRTHFFIMQYVPGESAGQYLKRLLATEKRAIPEEEALRIAIAATRGLAAAHAKGIVHRDVKPDNILIPDGDFDGAKLADLGLAKPEGSAQTFGTLSHIAMGTPGYMAPEQAEDARSAGPQADVFSMGATFYALVAGTPPFHGTSLVAVLRSAMQDEPPPLPDGVSAGIRWVIDRCLCKRPSDRFRDGAELLAALERVRKNPNATMAKPRKVAGAVDLTEGAKSRTPLWIGAAALALVLVVVGVVVAKGRGKKEVQPEPLPRVAEKDDVEVLFERAARLEKEGRLQDALSTLSRVAAFAPDDPRLKPMRDRIEVQVMAAKSSTEKADAWRAYLPAADAARTAADFADTPEKWDKALEAYEKLAPAAQSEGEKAKVAAFQAEGHLRRDWAASRVAEKAGDGELALELAHKAAAAGPKNEFLDAWIAGLEKRAAEADIFLERKKRFAAAVTAAEAEIDPAKAVSLWEKAIDLADDPMDRERAVARQRDITARLQGAEREKLFDVAMREAAEALTAGNLDVAKKRFQDAASLKEGDTKAAEGLRAVAERLDARNWEEAQKEIEQAKTLGDKVALKEAYRKALRVRNDPGISKALSDLESEAVWIKPVVTPAKVELVIDAQKNIRMEFARLKHDTFTMGAGADARRVVLTKDFAMQTTEVTQDQWNALMPPLGFFAIGGNLPAECMNWFEAMEYVEKLNERLVGWTACLPSSAQWEYACRAGSKSDWGAAASLEEVADYAWIAKNSENRTHAVATRKPNAWGLYDMQGNVFELTWDWLAPVPSAAKDLVDPVGPGGATDKIARGGAYCFPAENALPSPCGPVVANGRHSDLGFRLILVQGKDGNPHVSRMSVNLDDARKVHMDFVLVRAGTFTTGAPGGSPDDVAHKVTFAEDFWIATTETTQAQWEALLGKHAFSHKGGTLPADNVSWADAASFLRKLATRTKYKTSLPTEAEWEYACRAGSTTLFLNGDSPEAAGAFGWHSGNAKESQPVGSLRPNVLGLFDMSGNVREWCQDWYGPFRPDALTDPTGPASGTERILRGGGWDEAAGTMASGARSRMAPDRGAPDTGFRVVLK